MAYKSSARERALFQLTLGAAAILIVLCLVALAVLGIARAVVAPDGEEQPPSTPPANEDENKDPSDGKQPEGEQTPDTPDVTEPTVSVAIVLPEGEDMGQAYIDSMVFFGESTTAHLRSRGVLTDGTRTKQVWADASNTMMLSLEILKNKIIYPETGEELTITEAAARKKPKYMVLAFGVNGLSNFAQNQRVYAASYAKLIGAIREASPDTTVILQTVYPVGRNYKAADEVNQKINLLNEWLPDIAKENGAYVVDTASCLKDETGMLRDEYAQQDGLHLSAAAYRAILQYMRTHGCP